MASSSANSAGCSDMTAELSSLVATLSGNNVQNLQLLALETLRSLAKMDYIKQMIIQRKDECGVLRCIVDILLDDNKQLALREVAAETLRNLSAAKEVEEGLNLMITIETGAIRCLIKSLSADHSPALQNFAANTLRNLVANVDHYYKCRIVEEGSVLGYLVRFLFDDSRPNLQKITAETLRHLAISSRDQFISDKIVMEEGALEGLVKCLFKHDDGDLQEEAAFALEGLIDTTGAAACDEGEMITGLVKALTEYEKPRLQYHAAMAFAFIARDRSIQHRIVDEDGAIRGLVMALSDQHNREFRNAAAWALDLLTSSDDDSIIHRIAAVTGLL